MATTSKLITKVKDGVLPLPSDPPFLKAALKLAKPRGWPKDFALNRRLDIWRQETAAAAGKAAKDFRAGKLKAQSPESVISKLRAAK